PHCTPFPYTTLFRSVIKCIKADPARITAGKQRTARRGTYRRCDVEVGETDTVRGHPVENRSLIDRRAVTPKIAVAEVVAVDKNEDRKSTRLNSSHVK